MQSNTFLWIGEIREKNYHYMLGIFEQTRIILDATHTLASSPKQKPFEVLRGAVKRLFRVVVKRHPKLEKKLPKQPSVKSEDAEAEKTMLSNLAQLGETVEELLPDHEGAVSEKLGIAKQIIEDERLLSHKGILPAGGNTGKHRRRRSIP